jgi:hypothetical protein
MSTRLFQSDPILESIAQFFGLRDCANVSKLNHSYHSKTWLYILNSSHRLSLLNLYNHIGSQIINLDFKISIASKTSKNTSFEQSRIRFINNTSTLFVYNCPNIKDFFCRFSYIPIVRKKKHQC